MKRIFAAVWLFLVVSILVWSIGFVETGFNVKGAFFALGCVYAGVITLWALLTISD